jgi:hypothetical protein
MDVRVRHREAGGGQKLARTREVLMQLGCRAEYARVVTRICPQKHEAGGGHSGEGADMARLVL